MSSKAARLKAKRASRGRPRMEGVAREPNGQVSRSGISHEAADAVALAARARQWSKKDSPFYPLTKDELRDQRASTFIGYLNMRGEKVGLSDEQHDAAMKFLELYAEYLRAIKAPNGLENNSTPGGSGDFVSDEYVEWAQKTIARYEACKRTIQREQDGCRINLWAALSLCVIRGEPHYHLVGDIRILCNAIARYFS